MGDFAHCHCVDTRDKIYGLLGLVERKERIEVDYGETPSSVYWRALDVIGRSYFPAGEERRAALLQVGLELGVTGHEECTETSVEYFRKHFGKTPQEMFGELTSAGAEVGG